MAMKIQKFFTFCKKSDKLYIKFKKHIRQTFNDKSPLLLATSLCLSLVSVVKLRQVNISTENYIC